MRHIMTGALAGAAILSSGGAYAITVTQNGDANALATALLGSGVTISNATLQGAAAASGTFSSGTSSIGISNGVILATGNVSTAEGPNNQDGAGTGLGTPGFADLGALIPGFTLYDGVRLDIDFTTDSGDVFFNFAFASEEYNEYANSSYNDVFGLFLDGMNIALIPGTSIPVSINNVNGGNPYGTNAQNSAYFVNNDPSDGGPFYDIQYDGFTKVFTAQGLGLTAGTHTLSFAIADAGDDVLDSAIFIQAGTLSSEPPPVSDVPLPAGMWLLGGALAAFGIQRRRKTV